MPGNISQYQVVIAGQIIAASLWNGMETNIIDNGLIPAGIDDYSATDGEMQTQTDPYPGGSTSRPTSLQGELERIRYQLKNITGETYWYYDPDDTVASLTTRVTTLEALIPSGTKMVFYQAAPPSGWTAVSANDKFLRVVTSGGTGGTTGGTMAASTSLAHSHTVNSHTHDLANHTHTLGNHTHTSAAHTHTVPYNGWTTTTTSITTDQLAAGSGAGRAANAVATSGSTTPSDTGGPSTNTSGTPSSNTSGSTSPGTDSQLSGAFAYADVIIATKN